MNRHRTSIINKHAGLVAQHFNNGSCSIEDVCVQPIEQITGDGRDPDIGKARKFREAYWMKELRTVFPYGLNDRCNGSIGLKRILQKLPLVYLTKLSSVEHTKDHVKQNGVKTSLLKYF